MNWQPAASLAVLRLRAGLLGAVRDFFRERGVLEVETPIVLQHAVTDVQLESIRLDAAQGARWLHTSPEYPMKRLLAAGSGDIFQVCRVFRAGESGRQHNPEFTMVEWYRIDADLRAIAQETAVLVALLLTTADVNAGPVEFVSYARAFEGALGIDPLTIRDEELAALAHHHGLASSLHSATRDDLLDFLVSTRVGPSLGRDGLTVLHHFPASQAALARLDPEDPRTALRFELYARGVELANGYVELANAQEQRARFESDLAERRRRGLPELPMDTRLLDALEAGLPPCAGVALGFDRVVMLAAGAQHIDDVLAFPWSRA